MLKQLQQLIVALSARGQQNADRRLVRTFMAQVARLVRSPADLGKNLEAIAALAQLHETETRSWVRAFALAEGAGGPFDACDLRAWLALAERAGVPAVPARQIIELDDEEMNLASGQVELPENAVRRGIRKRMATLPEFADLPQSEREGPADRAARVEALTERLFAAMDDVPEGWMVRSSHCGGDTLKSLAGAGVAGPEAPEVKFGPDLEVGPGWLRVGNRRRVTTSDSRTVMMAAQGPGGEAFLARPWMESERYIVTDDPHRHGTAFQGKGLWPAEWRAFVENNVVVGVAVYYPWTGEVSELNARMALEVRELAQRVVDEAVAQQAWPRFLDVEFARVNPQVKANPVMAGHLSTFGRENVSCTLDFLEVKDSGLMLLEGGPGNTPFGGGHPCAFAGVGGPPRRGNKTITEGVAFRLLDGVSLADPATWNDGDRSDRILNWEEVAALAATPDRATAP